jgi:hypothetical protein
MDSRVFHDMMVRRLKSLCAYVRIIILGAKSQYKSLPGMIISSLAPPLIIAAAFIAAGPLISGAFAQPKLNLVFCDLEGSAYFDTVLNLLLSDESVTKTITVRKLEYNEAISELSKGEADAVIIFPESFISDMSKGINRPVKILGSEADPVRTVYIKEFMQSAADQLSAAQSAINTVWFSADRESMSETRRNLFFTTLVLEFTSKAFARSIYFTFNNVDPPFEGISPAAFLITSALAAIIFFGSLAGVKQVLFERRTGITTRLAASGSSGARVAFYHIAPIYIKQLLCAAFALLIALPVIAVTAAAAGYEAYPDISADAAALRGGNLSVIGGFIDSAMDSLIENDAEGGGDGAEDGAKRDGNDGEANGGEADGAKADGAERDEPSDMALSDRAGDMGKAPDTERGGNSFRLSDLPDIIKMTVSGENFARYINAFVLLCVLCLFTSSIALFLGCMMNRAESADVLIITLGIFMAVAGGTVIPYPYLPDIFQAMGPFSFNRHAQSLIASALFGNGAADGAAAALAAFSAAAAAFFIASILKIKYDRI